MASHNYEPGNVYWGVIQTRGFSADSVGEAYDRMAFRMEEAAKMLRKREICVDAGVDVRVGDPGGGGGGPGIPTDYYVDLGKFNVSASGLPEAQPDDD